MTPQGTPSHVASQTNFTVVFNFDEVFEETITAYTLTVINTITFISTFRTFIAVRLIETLRPLPL